MFTITIRHYIVRHERNTMSHDTYYLVMATMVDAPKDEPVHTYLHR